MKQSLAVSPHHHSNAEKTVSLQMSTAEYLLWNLIGGILYHLSFLGRVFVELGCMGELGTKVILTAGAVVWFTAGLALTFRDRRTFASVAGNVLPPSLLYFLLTDQGGFYTFMLWTVAVCTMLTSVFSLQRHLPDFRKGTHYFSGRLIRDLLLRTRNTAAVVFAVLLFFSGLWSIAASATGCTVRHNNTPAYCTIPDSKDELSVFKAERWSTATESEKVRGLQAAADIEACELGLPDRLTVSTQELDLSALACYNHKTRSIRFDRLRLAECTPVTALKILLHECYHAQQFSMIDIYDALSADQQRLSGFGYLELYKNELSHYENGENDYELYRSQQIETDARSYADQAVMPYIRYLSESKTEQ